MIATVAGFKGGVGKTTTSYVLALQLARRGEPTVLVDADDVTRGASTWWEQAEADGWMWPSTLTLTNWQAMTRPLTGHAVIDCGPGDPSRVRDALALSDTAVVPVRAEVADVNQVGKTASVVEKAATEHTITWGLLLTHVLPRVHETALVRSAIAEKDFPLLDMAVPFRRDYARMTNTVPEHYGEYATLLDELEA